MAILELEENRKVALKELMAYKVNAKTMEQDLGKQQSKAADWEKRAMMAVRAGDDEAAKTALREQKACLVEAAKIARDRDEAAGLAIALNKSRKQFETKLASLKLRQGTLATQLASARSAGGNVFGHDNGVWDRFAAAEDKIDQASTQAEVDASMGDDSSTADFDAKLLAASREAGNGAALLESGSGISTGSPIDDELAALKAKADAKKKTP